MTQRDAGRRTRSEGFTLIELMVVITILGLLASIVSVNVLRSLREAKVETTKQKMMEIKHAIMLFHMKKNRIPSSLQELCGPEGDDNRFLESEAPPKDGWDGEFIYTPRDKKNYDLMSYGSDGMEGGEDDAKDITLADLGKTDEQKGN